MATFTSGDTGMSRVHQGETMGIADKTYYLDENRELTEDQSKAAFVLINQGQEIPADMADKYGIGKVAQKAEKAEQPQAEKAGASDEDATVTEKAKKPAANKAKTPAKDKGAK